MKAGAPRSVLVVCMRRIGDVLLATPVVRSIKAAWPDAAIDMLVFKGTEGVLVGNPDLRQVIAVGEREGFARGAALVMRLWRRYDHAISVQSGDRPTLMAWAAGRRATGFAEPGPHAALKRKLLDDAIPADPSGEHTVAANLRLLAPLGVPALAAVRVAWDDGAEMRARAAFPGLAAGRPFALLHVSPKFAYKQWTPEGWGELARWLESQAMAVVIAGGASAAERAHLQEILRAMPASAVDISGRLDLAALAWLIERAKVFVGTDTAVTHMAAALGVPTVAIFGPSSPVRWGPWPKDFAAGPASPWKMLGTQRQGNVLLLQGETDCVPCLEEGCERHVESRSDCLLHLHASRAILAVQQVLFPVGVRVTTGA